VPSRTLDLLIVEDAPDDAELVVLELARSGYEVRWQRVDTEGALRAALEQKTWDIVISDFAMPRFDGLQAFDVVRHHGADVPFIFVSGALGEERAVEAMRAGARDYILKGNLRRLSVAVQRELREAENRRQRKLAEESNERERRRLALAVQASGAGVYEYRVGGAGGVYVSPRFAEILGYAAEEVTAEALPDWLFDRIHPSDRKAAIENHMELLSGQRLDYRIDVRVQRRDGAFRNVMCLAKAAERDSEGRLTRFIGVLIDNTEQHQVEDQLRHSQKMEAIGLLAGGVAHDFNNLLTAISNFGQFVFDTLEAGSQARDDMEQVLSASTQAAALTRQLLQFSRREPNTPRVTDLNAVITEMEPMLKRLLGERIEHTRALEREPWPVRIDPNALQQVLMNLAVNARDAMPQRGRLSIESSNLVVDEERVVGPGLCIPKGSYACVAVTDTGGGMDEATLQRIFEPFFTTKEAGRGTGLGLATCYGIVRQAGGFIWAESEVGWGATFRVLLPLAAGTSREEPKPVSARPHGTGQCVLLVEDDRLVLTIATRMIEDLGYEVISALGAAEALALGKELERVDVLLSDIIMPQLTGPEVAAALRARVPGLRVLYMSGYTANAIEAEGMLDPGMQLLQKPFTSDSLARALRAVLDRGSS
jgi:PAS domain S-box-containing protein